MRKKPTEPLPKEIWPRFFWKYCDVCKYYVRREVVYRLPWLNYSESPVYICGRCANSPTHALELRKKSKEQQDEN